MARINIEDSLDSDKRFFKLALALGSQELAMGAMVYAWRLAQRHWKTDERFIPVREFHEKVSFSEEIIKSGMATLIDPVDPDGEPWVYVRGADEQFNWIVSKQAAGKKGGSSKAKQTQANESKPKQEEPVLEFATNSKPLLSSAPLSSSHSLKEFNAVGEKPAAAERTFFDVEAIFLADRLLSQVMRTIATSVQQNWIRRYDENWLMNTLTNAVHYHMEKENVSKPLEIRDWGLRLGKWLRREKRPLLIESGQNLMASIEEYERDLARDQKNGVEHGT